jgi:large subunit ribosomal protein L4
MEVSVYNITGTDTGRKVELSDSVFAIEPNDHAIYLDVKQFLANKRQGTHKSKERGEVAGSTKKLKKQKGTGTARSGSILSPVFVGGGRVFGPKPRDYSFKLNKKLKQLARKSALAYKAKNNNLCIIEDFNLEQPKTKSITSIINSLKIENKSLLVVAELNKNIYLSARNLQDTKVVVASEITTYDIMNASKLVMLESSVAVINKLLN